MLTTAGRDWLATYAGSGGCFVDSGVPYVDADGISGTGDSVTAVTVLITAKMVGKPDAPILAGKSYNNFKTVNGGDMDDYGSDLDWVIASTPPTGSYCVSAPPPGPGPGEPSVAGEFTVTTPGPVSGTMSLSAVALKWKNSTGKLDIDDINVTNTSSDDAYFAIFARIWSAPQTVCPTTGAPRWKGADRTTGDNIATKGLDAGENGDINYDGIVGPGTLAAGSYVACVELWANYSNADLKDELAAA